MQMSEEDVLDLQAMLLGEHDVLLNIALRINHDRRSRPFITNDVRCMGQTRQIKLLQDQGTPILNLARVPAISILIVQ
jgi:hypothetical protein